MRIGRHDVIVIRSFNRRHSLPFLILASLSGFALIGTLAIIFTKAASPTVSIEAENSIVTGNAAVNDDATASSSRAVKFGSAASTNNPLSSLPLIPWEGGPNYWKQFAKADAAGWDDPNFFPIVIAICTYSNDAEIQWDKAHGINTYLLQNDWTPYNLLGKYNMFYLGREPFAGMPQDYAQWVGYALDDETDGRYSPPETGMAYLQGLVDQINIRNDGRFKYSNFTQMTVTSYWDQKYPYAYINNYTDAVSLDMYWYTIPLVQNYNVGDYVEPVHVLADHRRTSSSYGAMVRGLRYQDARDGKLQPLWMFVENWNGGPAESGSWQRYIEPGEVKGAVMNSIINEARGIEWFNTSMSGPNDTNLTGNVLRQAQVNPSFPGKPQVEAMGEINNQVQRLAPIINTQSYQYSFGNGLDTMLKWYNGSAYIFAMIDGNSGPGNRTFTLPSGLAASSIEVIEENRTIPITNGTFTDNFAAEYSYHIYKITP